MLAGVGDGTQPLLSYYHGAGRQKEVVQIQKIAYVLAGCIGVTAMCVTICLTPYIGRWFGLSGEALNYFETGMRISATAFIIIGFVKFNTTYLNAIMQTKKAVLLTFSESLFVTPILLYVLPYFKGLNGVWLAFPVTAACMILIYRFMNVITRKTKEG